MQTTGIVIGMREFSLQFPLRQQHLGLKVTALYSLVTLMPILAQLLIKVSLEIMMMLTTMGSRFYAFFAMKVIVTLMAVVI